VAGERGHAPGDVELLRDRHGYAVQRSVPFAWSQVEEPCLLAGLVREHDRERIELGVARLDTGECLLDHGDG
jgi:hypothetical protein